MVGTESDKQSLALIYRGTKRFTAPAQLLSCTETIKRRRNWTAQTCRIFLNKVSNFVDYCFLFHDGVTDQETSNAAIMQAAIKQARKAYSKQAGKNYRQVARNLRAKVPSAEIVRARRVATLNLLNANLNIEQKLSYKQLQALNFFLLQLRLNTRTGPLVHFKWSEFEQICETNQPILSDKSKTGNYYEVLIFIEDDQRQFLCNMREQYLNEFPYQPTYVFSSSVNTVERSISRHLREVFYSLFGDNPDEVRFNANSIRKFWERRWKLIKSNFSEGITKAHFAQTGHTEKTAEDLYIGREGSEEDRRQLLKIYESDLINGVDGIAEDDNGMATDESSDDSDIESDQETENNNTRGSKRPREQETTDSEPVAENEVPQTMPPQTMPPPVKRFNPARDSLNSTMNASMVPNDTGRTQFIKSLQSFRSGRTQQDWTEDEKTCCMLFSQVTGTPPVEDVKARIEEAGYKLSKASYWKIYQKIKAAIKYVK